MLPLAVSDEAVTGGAVVLGALIGVTAGGVVDFLLDRVRERRRAKAGARLVALDLALADSSIQSVEHDGQWWQFYDLRMTLWNEYCDVLATRLTSEGSEAVSQAVAGLARLGSQMSRFLDGRVSAVLRPNAVERLGAVRADAAAAYNALAGLAGHDRVEGVIHPD